MSVSTNIYLYAYIYFHFYSQLKSKDLRFELGVESSAAEMEHVTHKLHVLVCLRKLNSWSNKKAVVSRWACKNKIRSSSQWRRPEVHPGSRAVGTECAGVHVRASKTGIGLRLLQSSAEAVVWEEMGEHDTLQDSDGWHAEKNSKYVDLADLSALENCWSTVR